MFKKKEGYRKLRHRIALTRGGGHSFYFDYQTDCPLLKTPRKIEKILEELKKIYCHLQNLNWIS